MSYWVEDVRLDWRHICLPQHFEDLFARHLRSTCAVLIEIAAISLLVLFVRIDWPRLLQREVPVHIRAEPTLA